MRWLLAVLLILSARTLYAGELHHPEDASLHGVFFFDAKEGWAVGDDGVIRHTIDGGKTWEDQRSTTNASLRGVHFLDESTGWAVGREERPFGGGSVGVVLFTRDGGVRWQRLMDNALPGLNAVRFTDRRTGLLMSDGQEPFTSGLLRTEDGGKSWAPVKGTHTPGWWAGDFQDGTNGILAGPWGRLATFRNDTWAMAEHELLIGRALRAVQILPKRLLAVGEGGLVLTSVSGGSAWGFGDLKLQPAVRTCLDFHAIASVEDHVWIAGRPGSMILASRDAGETWTATPTGQALPLHAIHFVDRKRGWAVGAGGTVLHTDDGGASWHVGQQASKRTPLLCVNARGADVPLDTLA